jgi:hypothetical protein
VNLSSFQELRALVLARPIWLLQAACAGSGTAKNV